MLNWFITGIVKHIELLNGARMVEILITFGFLIA